MFKLILAFYIISGNGAVGVHTQVVASDYKTVQECDVAGKKAKQDLSMGTLEKSYFETKNDARVVIVQYSCTK